jgi:hypothetical protein
MTQTLDRKALQDKFKDINKSGDFQAWEELVFSNDIYGNNYRLHVTSDCKGVFQHQVLTKDEPIWTVALDATIEYCNQNNLTLANFFKESVLLKEGNTFKCMIKDTKGSLGTSPPLLLFQPNNNANQEKGNQAKQTAAASSFNWRSANDWVSATAAISAASGTLLQAIAALKANDNKDSSISDIASLITALNSQGNNNELLFKFFEMQQQQRNEDTKRFEELIEQMQTSANRDPYQEMERTEELLERIQAKAKPTPPPMPPNAGPAVGDSFWDKGLDLVGKLLDTAQNSQPEPAPPAAQLPAEANPELDRMLEEMQTPGEEMTAEEQIKQADLEITQQIIDQAAPFKVVSDIGFLVKSAMEEGLIQSIEEVVEADFDIEQSFNLYIRNRSTNPQYTDELLAAAKTFLPMVKNIELKPTDYDQNAIDISTISTLSPVDLGAEESPTA